jgi:hypothetical protein
MLVLVVLVAHLRQAAFKELMAQTVLFQEQDLLLSQLLAVVAVALETQMLHQQQGLLVVLEAVAVLAYQAQELAALLLEVQAKA